MTQNNKNDIDIRQRPVSLDEELLNIIANQVKSSPYAITLSMAIIAYMMSRHLPDQPWIWGGWMMLIVLTQIYRMYRLPRLPKETHLSPKRRTREAAVLNITGIGIQSLSLIAFPLFTPFEACVQTMIFVGMGVGSILTAVGWAPYTLSHIWLTLIPMYALWAWSGLYGPGGTLGIMVAVVGIAYSGTIWLISKRLYRMNREFFENRAALSTALRDAEDAGAAKTRFLAAASHDLRQPIHTLSLFSAALGMRSLDDRSRDISENIDEAVKALSSQLDALLDVSKLDAGVVPVNPTGFDLSEMIDRLCRDAKASAEAENIQINAACPPDAIAHSDPALLERVIRNLLTNAITHNRDCELNLRVLPLDRKWEITISDSGTGIPESEKQHIFEEFFQVSNPERDRSKGLGLGLSIVKRLANLLDMDMQFQSRVGVGTSFTFTVPIDNRREVRSPEQPELTGRLDSTRVLVVDDEPAVRDAMKTLLEMSGCRVWALENTESALEQARETRPDIALVDYRLRGSESGLETIQQLRQVHPGLPAILISGDTAPNRLQEAKAAGIKLLSKPVEQNDLYQAIALQLED